MKVEERLLKYVSYWTTSDESCSDIPSSEREFTLAKALKQELETLGLTNILLTDHCYVYAKLPATPGMENCKSIGFIAHMDTAPDFSGKDGDCLQEHSFLPYILRAVPVWQEIVYEKDSGRTG